MQITAGLLDGDPASRAALQQALERIGRITVQILADRDELATRCAELDVLFLDAEVQDAFRLLEETKRARPELEIVMVTGVARMEFAVKAVRLGAGDYLAKPVRPEQAASAVDRARRVKRLVEENRRLKEQLRGSAGGIVGVTAGMKRVQSLVEPARSARGVLILGEPGTEREAVARAIHHEGPFVKVDAEALGPEAAADELGARGRALERAAGGTLFIDEVALVPPAAQELVAQADARIVAGSARNLLEAVGRGEFRMDLLTRLSALTFAIPPLRERREDLPLLVDAILRRRAAEGKTAAKSVAQDAMETLSGHDWPGNVRELEAAVERACELGSGEWIERRLLPPAVIQGAEAKQKTGSAEVTKSLKEMESEVIRQLLSDHKGDTDGVARILKIDRSTLYRKIKRYGIDLDHLK